MYRQERTRVCTNADPSDGGNSCEGVMRECKFNDPDDSGGKLYWEDPTYCCFTVPLGENKKENFLVFTVSKL